MYWNSYLTAFALYLGVSVYGLPGLLVGPLGLSVLTVLYESMIEEENTIVSSSSSSLLEKKRKKKKKKS